MKISRLAFEGGTLAVLVFLAAIAYDANSHHVRALPDRFERDAERLVTGADDWYRAATSYRFRRTLREAGDRSYSVLMTQQALFREINRALEKANDAMRKQRLFDLQRHRVIYGDLF